MEMTSEQRDLMRQFAAFASAREGFNGLCAYITDDYAQEMARDRLNEAGAEFFRLLDAYIDVRVVEELSRISQRLEAMEAARER